MKTRKINITITAFASLLLIFQYSCTKKDVNPPEDSTAAILLAEGGIEPAWSPDGKKIAYIQDYHSLYLMNADGSNKRELATDIMESFPIWSPSGDYILYTGHSPTTGYVLIRIDANGANRKDLCGDTTHPRLASWSPDGQKIVLITWTGLLAVINADGTNFQTLTTGVYAPETPRWSPDMNKIMFTTGADDERDIYFINSDGNNLVRLPIDSTYETQVQFSNDGSRVFFRGTNYLWGSSIFSVNRDGSGFVNLTNDMEFRTCSSPQLSPDGTKIAFAGEQTDVEAGLYIMNTDGSGKQLLHGEGAEAGTWSPDGKEIAFVMNKDSKEGVYSIRIDQ